MFFGRSALLKRIFSLLANGQSISLIGDRRIGKSSLLYCLSLPEIQQRMGRLEFNNHVFSYLDLQGSMHRSPEDLLSILINNLNKSLAEQAALDLHGTCSPDQFEDAITQINQLGFQVIFLLDEFDSLTLNKRLDASYFSFLRYMATNHALSLVTVSHRRLAELCHAEIVDSPFFNIFAVATVGALEADEAIELITVPSARERVPLAEHSDWILDLAGEHPFLIQMAAFYLFEEYVHHEKADHARAEALYYEEAKDHFAYAWSHVKQGEQQILQMAALQEQGPYKHYLAASRAFRRFARTQMIHADVDIEIDPGHVKGALEHLWDAVWLGNCDLARMSIVRRRLVESELTPGPANSGKALQYVLIAAIAQLKPGDCSSKANRGYRQWFILNQCYEHEATNKEIIARLNIAERSFYRERNMAIEALCMVLRDMENKG